MRVSNLLIMGALSALVFTGCTNNDDNSEWLDSNSVTFNSRIDGLQTKASKDVWSNGDEVGIFMTTQTAEFANKKYVASDGGTLTAATGQTLRYPEEGTASFIAYYPYSASLNGKTLAVSVDNQADPAKVDLLYSDNAKAIAAGEAVDLAFKHKLSQIVIAVGSDETLPDISGLKISLSGMNTQADFNLADGTLAAKESKANIEMNVSADGSTAEAIILPTTTLDGVKMTFVLDGKTFEWPVSVNGGAGFEAGYKYTYTATLSTENGKPAVTMGGASIESWTDQPGGDINVDFGEGGGEQPEGVVFIETFGTPEKNGTQWPLVKDYAGFDNPKEMFEDATGKLSVRTTGTDKKTNVWFSTNVEHSLKIKNIDMKGATTATLEYEVGANVYDPGASQDLATLKVRCNGVDLAVPSKVVSKENNEANLPFKLVIENVAVSDKTTLEFYCTSTDNTCGLRLFSVKLSSGEGGGPVEPEPEPEPTPGNNLLINPGFEEWGEKLPIKWDNSKYNTGEIVKEATIKHSGDYSLRQTSGSGTNKIQQEAEVLGGKKYRLSYWFLDNDAKASSRYWFALVDANGKTVNDLNAEIQQEEYSVDNPDWQQVKIEITMPENVVKVRFEARIYRNTDTDEAGGYIYYDDMELIQLD